MIGGGSNSSEPSPPAAAAAEVIANNVDLLTELLLRLPAKSLIRFQCVSKHWLSLISNSQFATNHSRRRNPRPSMSGLYFYSHRHGQLESVSLHGRHRNPPPLALGFPIRVLHSCNGLLLCKNASNSRYIVCNPTTRRYTLIPDHPSVESYKTGYLAFDPSKSSHYKVILFSHFSPDQIDVYCSQSVVWKQVFSQHRGFGGGGVFWNGALHWLCDENLLWIFDVDEEKMTVIPCPKIVYLGQIRYFGECGGRLLLIKNHIFGWGFRVLEMDKDYSGWIMEEWVDFRSLLPAFPETASGMDDMFSVISVVEGGNRKNFVLVLAMPGKIISYNLQSNTRNVLREFAPGELMHYDGYACPFVESLSPV